MVKTVLKMFQLPAAAGCASLGELIARIFFGLTLWLGATPCVPAADSGAEAYYAESVRLLQQVERNLPQITATAERAAGMYIADDRLGMGTDGQFAFFAEAQGRSGGIMTLAGFWPWERREH